MESAWEYAPARKHFQRFDPGLYEFTLVFRQIELDGFLCFTLDDRNTHTYLILSDQVDNIEVEQIAATQLAVDGDVKQS